MAEQADLTPREHEVLDLLRLGLTNEEIAGRLGMTLDGAKHGAPPGFALEYRSSLSLCVDDGSGGVSDEAVDLVRHSLETVLTAEAELPGAYEQREVTAGCPAPAAA